MVNRESVKDQNRVGGIGNWKAQLQEYHGPQPAGVWNMESALFTHSTAARWSLDSFVVDSASSRLDFLGSASSL